MSFIGNPSDPVAAIREILAGGPVAAAEFRQRAHDAGIPFSKIGEFAKMAGATYRREGGVAANGRWVWALTDQGFGIITEPGRPGLYARFFHRGVEVHRKLTDTDDMEEAKREMAALVAALDAEDEVLLPRSRNGERPPPMPNRNEPLSEQLRQLARQLVRLCRKARQLEEKGVPT